MRTIELADGGRIPALGFGTYQIPKEDTKELVLAALEAGYRHIDTAQVYMNEKEVGEALQETSIPREEIFVTSKIWVQDVTAEKARTSIEGTLRRMQLDYIDLMLIHQPYNDIYAAWRVMQELQKEGKIRHIGVSNFPTDKLVDLATFGKALPVINQIEINPFHQQKERVAALKAEGVVAEAWAPFAEGRNNLFSNPDLVAISQKYSKSVAQIVIRYLLDQDLVVLAKSSRIERMRENLDVEDFELDQESRDVISTLDMGETLFANHADPERIRAMRDFVVDLEE